MTLSTGITCFRNILYDWFWLIDPCSFVVLAVIQEKVNNPSPDDPFEPEIAAVRFGS